MKNFIYLIFLTFSILSCADSVSEDENVNDFTKDSGTFIDERDGNEYKWVKIGDQVWIAENLKYLPYTYFTREDQPLTAAYFVYDYFGASVEEAKATENFEKYGVLYNYMATLEACPAGWHVPTDDDWEELAEYISSQNGDYNKFEYSPDESGAVDDWEEVGKHLKSNYDWELPYDYEEGIGGSGTDDFGFTALPAGAYVPDNNHDFGNLGEITFYWSSTDRMGEGYPAVYGRHLPHDDNNLYRFPLGKSGGAASIRCIKD
ncbi:MAG: fibrobacter succinogenes major paralogous domain-containing protein [Bacteroidetes bacterium]|nr:fibrobacter succinogenes major paralogous domain-containing protein [Bacteroidota bacterium]